MQLGLTSIFCNVEWDRMKHLHQVLIVHGILKTWYKCFVLSPFYITKYIGKIKGSCSISSRLGECCYLVASFIQVVSRILVDTTTREHNEQRIWYSPSCIQRPMGVGVHSNIPSPACHLYIYVTSSFSFSFTLMMVPE